MATEDVAFGIIFSKQQIGRKLFDIQSNDSPCNENTPGFCGHLVLDWSLPKIHTSYQSLEEIGWFEAF